mmetsp:Transcript_25186/g.75668  ORF Transcript_25186/g.75668 Transcript_25186/m.75668 type:complete len:312 (+) Transcript_25186:318-1253(+)
MHRREGILLRCIHRDLVPASRHSIEVYGVRAVARLSFCDQMDARRKAALLSKITAKLQHCSVDRALIVQPLVQDRQMFDPVMHPLREPMRELVHVGVLVAFSLGDARELLIRVVLPVLEELSLAFLRVIALPALEAHLGIHAAVPAPRPQLQVLPLVFGVPGQRRMPKRGIGFQVARVIVLIDNQASGTILEQGHLDVALPLLLEVVATRFEVDADDVADVPVRRRPDGRVLDEAEFEPASFVRLQHLEVGQFRPLGYFNGSIRDDVVRVLCLLNRSVDHAHVERKSRRRRRRLRQRRRRRRCRRQCCRER